MKEGTRNCLQRKEIFRHRMRELLAAGWLTGLCVTLMTWIIVIAFNKYFYLFIHFNLNSRKKHFFIFWLFIKSTKIQFFAILLVLLLCLPACLFRFFFNFNFMQILSNCDDNLFSRYFLDFKIFLMFFKNHSKSFEWEKKKFLFMDLLTFWTLQTHLVA